MTFNLKDFPAATLSPYGLEACHPDDFFMDQFGISPELFIAGVKEDYHHYKPKMPVDDYINRLAKADLPKTARLIDNLKVILS